MCGVRCALGVQPQIRHEAVAANIHHKWIYRNTCTWLFHQQTGRSVFIGGFRAFVAVVEYRLWCLLDRYSSASNFIPNLVTVKKKHWEHLCVCTSEPLLLNGNRNKNNNNLQTNEILRIGQFFESYMKLVLFGYGSIVFICFRCIQLIFTCIFEDKKTIYIICCTTTLSIRIRVSFFMFYCIDTTSGKHDT